MTRAIGRRHIGFLVFVCACAAALAVVAYLRSPNRGLPYHASFDGDRAADWKAIGGTWNVSNGAMHNISDDRGAKLLTGSEYWRNYSVEADVMLLGQDGDAGLIIRSSNEEEGTDAYTGYYAGLRNRSNALVFGRAQHEWLETSTQLVTIPGGVRSLQWYHLKLLAFNCQLIAVASLPGSETMTAMSFRDESCIPAGRVGLRSYSSGGAWKNVVVRSASAEEAADMLKKVSSLPTSSFTSPQRATEFEDFSISPQHGETTAVTVTQIGELGLSSYANATLATVRGTVILTSPSLFVQDASGGVEAPNPYGPPLKVGDEVEATGQVHPGDFNSTLEHASVRILWAQTPAPAVSVTASEAATGAFSANFVEVEGILLSKSKGPNNTFVFNLEYGSQSFRAITERSRGEQLFQQLKPGSLLRLRGICVVDPRYTQYLTPFVMLLRSPDELTIVAGPPWWNRTHLTAIAAGILILAVAINFLYSRAEHWRLQAVFKERERLAQEMHDTLAQSFAGIGFQIEAIRGGMPEGLPRIHQQLDLATHLVRYSHEEARRSIAALRPESLQTGDLIGALTYCAERLVKGGEIRIETSRTGDVGSLPVRVIDTLYRIGQEALANAVSHAQASVITLALEYQPDSIRLLIRDNGIGFMQSGMACGFGLSGMRKRASSISAAIRIESEPAHGTLVDVTVPLAGRDNWFFRVQLLWSYLMGRETDVAAKP